MEVLLISPSLRYGSRGIEDVFKEIRYRSRGAYRQSLRGVFPDRDPRRMAPPGGRFASLLYVSLSSFLLGSIPSLSVVFFLIYSGGSPSALGDIVVIGYASRSNGYACELISATPLVIIGYASRSNGYACELISATPLGVTAPPVGYYRLRLYFSIGYASLLISPSALNGIVD